MTKLKHYKVEVTSEISETGLDARKKFAESDSGKEFGIFTEQKNGKEKITFGPPLQPNEFSGEGLPKSEDENSLCFEMNFSFDLRVSHNGHGDIELIVAQKGTKRHSIFVLEGLDAKQAEIAVFEFRQRMSNCTVPKDFYYLIWACYRKQDENADVRKESYEKIFSVFESRFRKLLMHGTYKPIESRAENGIEVTKSIAEYRGREKGTKNLKPKITLEMIKEKIKQFKGSSTFPTQTLVAKRLGVSNKTIQRCLESAGIDLKYNDYVYSIISN